MPGDAALLATDLAAALDPVALARSLGFEPDPWQRQLLRSSSKRAILNCSRQSGKSTTTALKALHRAHYRPGSLILLISPSLRQSSELFRKVTDFRKSMDAPPPLIEDNKLSATFANGSRIVSLPSKEGTIRGFSDVDLIIEDEASKVPDELYRAVRPMLSVSDGDLILMATPFGKRGHFYHTWEDRHVGRWEPFKITAHDCPRISDEFLEEERRELGEWFFKQEYLCEFMENVDSIFDAEAIDEAFTDDVKPLFEGSANHG